MSGTNGNDGKLRKRRFDRNKSRMERFYTIFGTLSRQAPPYQSRKEGLMNNDKWQVTKGARSALGPKHRLRDIICEETNTAT